MSMSTQRVSSQHHTLDESRVYDLNLDDRTYHLYSQMILMYSHPSSSRSYSFGFDRRPLRKQV